MASDLLSTRDTQWLARTGAIEARAAIVLMIERGIITEDQAVQAREISEKLIDAALKAERERVIAMCEARHPGIREYLRGGKG